jgi:TolB-like protein
MMLDSNERASDPQGGGVRLKAMLKSTVRYSATTNGHADADVVERGLLACEPEFDEPISEHAIRAELFRILESSLFVQSDRLGRFLRFTVEKTVAGESETLKEYLIGTEVYQRPSSYCPSEDSIVRSEARRLRTKLREYYDSAGKNDPVSIHYRPGSYVPLFRNQSEPVVNATAIASGALERFTAERDIRISVLPFSDATCSGASGAYAQLITDELIHELVRTDGVRVTAASAVAPLVARAIDVRTLARILNVEFIFEGTVREDNNLLRIIYRVANAADGFHIWSERVDTEFDLQGLSEVSERIASSLVNRILTSKWLSDKHGGIVR